MNYFILTRSRNFIYRLQLRLRPKVSAPCGSRSGSTTLPDGDPNTSGRRMGLGKGTLIEIQSNT
jgi:hypothetical protein